MIKIKSRAPQYERECDTKKEVLQSIVEMQKSNILKSDDFYYKLYSMENTL